MDNSSNLCLDVKRVLLIILIDKIVWYNRSIGNILYGVLGFLKVLFTTLLA